MVFSEETYSVLVVSSVPKFNDILTQMLPGTEYYPVCFVNNIAAAKRELLSRNFDLVIVNAPLPDDYGTRFAIDACGKTGTVAMILVRADAYEEINAKVQPQGVFTLPKPTSTQTLQQGLKWMASARERLRRLEKKAITIEEKMEEIRQVNRAKWLLIEQLKMTESDAHRYIEKQAMDRCVSRLEIAKSIIRTYT